MWHEATLGLGMGCGAGIEAPCSLVCHVVDIIMLRVVADRDDNLSFSMILVTLLTPTQMCWKLLHIGASESHSCALGDSHEGDGVSR